MPRAAVRPPSLRRRIFRASSQVERGILTPKRLRSNAWRRLFRDVYVDSSIEDSHRLRCAAAAAYLLPSTGVIAGRSAACLLGAGLATPDDPVEILVPSGAAFGPMRGMRVHAGDLAEAEIQRVDNVPVTEPLRTCWDLALWLGPVEAVVLIDRFLALGLVTRAALVAYGRTRVARRGSRAFARAVELADGRAASPPESRVRVRLMLAGLPRPEVQYAIYRDATFLGRVDLAWPELKIAIEYDGVWHIGSARQMHADRARLNRLVADGWAIIHVTSARMGTGFPELVAEIRATIRARQA